MTGDEHYRKAERQLAEANTVDLGTSEEAYLLAASQVHATLALAAAVATRRNQYRLRGYGLPDPRP